MERQLILKFNLGFVLQGLCSDLDFSCSHLACLALFLASPLAVPAQQQSLAPLGTVYSNKQVPDCRACSNH